jgi:hypothetical protein
MAPNHPALLSHDGYKFPAEESFFKEPVSEEQKECISFNDSLTCFPLIRQELLEAIPYLGKFNFGVLALKSWMLLANELSVRFIVDNGGIISPVDDC